MNAKQSRLLATMERKHKLMNGASDEIQREFLKDVLVLEENIWEVEEEFQEAGEELRKLTVQRRKAEAEELRVSDTHVHGCFGQSDSVRSPKP